MKDNKVIYEKPRLHKVKAKYMFYNCSPLDEVLKFNARKSECNCNLKYKVNNNEKNVK